jgi:hypothetical protein
MLALATMALGVCRTHAQETHVIVVSGLGGEPVYQDLFRTQATALLDAARDRWGLSDGQLSWLAEDRSLAPDRIVARSTRENVQGRIGELAERIGTRDQVLIVLIGHGSESGGESKLNLPGPDLTASDLGSWLEAFPTQTVAVVNTSSASGGFLPALSRERRIVMTATRSARERNRTHFGSFFVNAFAGEGADTDKDERVSLLEAFSYARLEVERLYSRDNRLQTEHALLDDDGDGEGSMQPGLDAGDGRLASRFFLAAARPAVTVQAADDPELAALLEKKRSLEDAVAELRARKNEMDPRAYETDLEALLLELASTNRAIRERDERP